MTTGIKTRYAVKLASPDPVDTIRCLTHLRKVIKQLLALKPKPRARYLVRDMALIVSAEVTVDIVPEIVATLRREKRSKPT